MAYLPAIWIMTALVVLFFGFAPRRTFVAWIALVGFVLISELGALLDLPAWVMNLSPFAHSPQLPGSEVDVIALTCLLLVAAALIVAGLVGWRRRDLHP